MTTEAGLYLRKARESLASAEADVSAGRYNSAANRAYYAAFQAAVAALIHAGIQPARTGDPGAPGWEHRLVIGQFAGKLVRRRKLYPAHFRSALDHLFDTRLVGDYHPNSVSHRGAARSLGLARDVYEAVTAVTGPAVREPKAIYHERVSTTKTKLTPEECVDRVRSLVLSGFPDVSVATIRRSERDFTLEVHGAEEDVWDVHEFLDGITSDILVDHDVWIVVLPLQSYAN